MPSLMSGGSTIVSAGTWTNTGNVYISDNTYASNTGATQNTEYPMDIGGFSFTSLPADATITDVTVTYEIKTGTNARAQSRAELLDGTTVLGSRALANLTNADVNLTFPATATVAQLKSANLMVRVVNKRIVSQASTTTLDFVKIDVTYTTPAVGFPKIWNGGAWVQEPAKVWTGAAWVQKPVKVWTGSVWKTLT